MPTANNSHRCFAREKQLSLLVCYPSPPRCAQLTIKGIHLPISKGLADPGDGTEEAEKHKAAPLAADALPPREILQRYIVLVGVQFQRPASSALLTCARPLPRLYRPCLALTCYHCSLQLKSSRSNEVAHK